MEIQLSGYEAEELLEKYYTDSKWPVTGVLRVANMFVTTNDEGYANTDWDIIDLKNKELIKASDYSKGEYGYEEDNDKVPEDYKDEYDNYYKYLEEIKRSTFDGEPPTCISVLTVLQAALTSNLNARGYQRKLDAEAKARKLEHQ